MTYEEQLRLMSILVNMGFGREFIIWTLVNCEDGMLIGNAMCNAIKQTARLEKFPFEKKDE